MARKDYIDLKTAIPGPVSMEWYTRDRASISPSYVRPYVLVADHATGMEVTDVDGNTYLDFTAGVAVNSTGHRHPEVVSAIKDQADKLVHMSGTDFFYPIQIELAEKIKEIAREHRIPIRENKPLAQALYKHVEIGQAIPEDLYQAVASILAQLDKFKRPGRPR